MSTPRVHRLRDLDGRSRWVALAIGLALALAPLVATATFLGRWTPAGDPALMALRGLDVGTSRTPLIGQPSTAHFYTGGAPVHHPGALHFYLMALPMRVLGGAVGVLLVSAAITGTALVASAWAVFRQLGRTAGVLAAVLLAAIAFTTGASSLVNPISSNIAGYPLLLSAVLLWCVACGDVRLLPAAAAAVSFTAQQHLSVGVATLVVTAGGLALLAATARREGWGSEAGRRRDLRRGVIGAGVVSAVLWAPVLVQQLVGDPGNLGQIVTFARHGNDDTLGASSALSQVARVVSLPPLLADTDVNGSTLLTSLGAVQWATAAVVVALVAVLGWRWRAAHPRRTMLCAMSGVLAIAGLLNGSSVPAGPEQTRLAFYHWVWPLTLFVGLVLGLAAADAVRRHTDLGAGARAVLAGAAVAAVLAPTVVNPLLDRRTNTLDAAGTMIERDVVDDLADQLVAHRDELGDHTVLLSRDEPVFSGMNAALHFRASERGLDLRLPYGYDSFVDDDRLVDGDAVDGAVVAVYVDDEDPPPAPPGGTLIAERRLDPTGFDDEAFRSLVDAAGAAGAVRLTDEGRRALDDGRDADGGVLADTVLEGLVDNPESALRNRPVVDFLVDHPPVEPALDPDELARLDASFGQRDWDSGVRAIRLYVLDREATLALAHPSELGSP